MKRLFLSIWFLAIALPYSSFGLTSNSTYSTKYVIDLESKNLDFEGVMAVAEKAIVEVRNIGDADPTSLMLYLASKANAPMALSTNMISSATSNSAIGELNLATTNLYAEFSASPNVAEKTYVLSIWDSERDILLGASQVIIKNNPLALQLIEGWTNLPSVVESELLESINAAILIANDAADTADEAYIAATNASAVAHNALDLVSQATTGNVDMVARAGVASNAASIAAIEPDASGWSGFAATQDVTIAAAPFSDGLYSYGLYLMGGTNANQFRAYETNLYLNGQRITTIADINTNYLPLAGGELGGTLSMAVSPVADGRYSRMIQFKGGPYTNSLFAYGENLFVADGSGGPLKRLFYWTDLATVTSDVVIASSTRMKKTVGTVDKDYPVAVVASGVTNFADESGLIDLGEIAGSGSGFPLTNNGDLAQYSLTNGLTVQATNGSFKSLTSTTFRAGTTILGPTTVNGDLTVNGTRYENEVVQTYTGTNVHIGVETTLVSTIIYSTNIVYQRTIVYTQVVSTNVVNTFVNIGGSFTMGSNSTFNATNANVVKFPGLVSTNGTNGATTTITGTLDVTGATIEGLVTEETDPVFSTWLPTYSPTEQDPLSVHTNALGTGLVWANNQLVVTGEGTAIVTNEVDPRRYDAFREYAEIDASSGTGTISTTSGLWLSFPASDEPRALAIGTGFSAGQAWRFYVKVGRGTNTFSIDTNLVGYSFLSLPISSTNHLLIDRYPGDSSFRVLQVHR